MLQPVLPTTARPAPPARKGIQVLFRAVIRCAWAVLGLLGALLPAQPAAASTAGDAPPRPVVTLAIKGAIGVASAMYIARAIEHAEQREAQLVLLQLDTPGGLVSSTREIIQAMLGSRIPVAIYVAPSGARAASAGTYMLQAAHVAAMAPGTHLGAATPVSLPGLPGVPGTPPTSPGKEGDQGEKAPSEGTAMERKVLNDAVALMRALTQMRGRNVEWAERAVTEAATLTASEALDQRVIDLVAPSAPELLAALDGREIKMAQGTVLLATRGATIEDFAPDLRVRALGALADPNIAFILMLIGIYGLVFEFSSPGFGIAGVLGAVSLMLALTALSLLPVHYGGLALLLVGLALMVGEALTPGVGVLGIGGMAAFVIGALFLFDAPDTDIAIGVAKPLIAGAALTSGALLVFVLGFALRARRRRVVSGSEEMTGARGTVVRWDGPEGEVRTHGEIWKARSDRPLGIGTPVRVVAREGLTLIVAPSSEGESNHG